MDDGSLVSCSGVADPSSSTVVNLTDDVMRGMRLTKVFHDCSHHVGSLEFDESGEHCLVACPEEESILLYDSLDGTLKKTLFSKKYGVGPVRFTHHRNNVIYGSGKGESQEAGTIRYLSLHDNAYLRYYRGHEAPISALRLCPTDDTFVSAAPGDTVRWWDLRAMACQGVLAINGPPLVDLDPTGLVFAVALEHRLLRLFDRRAYERGPFAAFEILDRTRAAGSVNWTSLTFSPDGRELLVGTDVGLIYLIDSFDGFVKGTFSGHESISGVPSRRRHTVEPAFTPDAQYILCGSSQDFKVHMWRRDQPDKSPFAALEGHTSCPSLVRFNPRLALMASACTNLAFWQP